MVVMAVLHVWKRPTLAICDRRMCNERQPLSLMKACTFSISFFPWLFKELELFAQQSPDASVNVQPFQGWGCGSVGSVSDWHAADFGPTAWCSKGFFSQSRLSVQTFCQCLYSPCLQSHALTSLCTLKIPSIGSHTFVWTHGNTACCGRNG